MTVSAGRSPQKSSVGWKWLIMMLLRCIALPVSFLLDTLIAMQRGYAGGKATQMLFAAMLATLALMLLMNLVPRLRAWFDRVIAPNCC